MQPFSQSYLSGIEIPITGGKFLKTSDSQSYLSGIEIQGTRRFLLKKDTHNRT